MASNRTPCTSEGGMSQVWWVIKRFLRAFLSILLVLAAIIIVVAAIIFVLLRLCLVNWPTAPDWNFLSEAAVDAWKWLDEWQMEHCPDLLSENRSLTTNLGPAFGKDSKTAGEPDCGPASINFTPLSAPAGTTINISLDGFMPDDNVHACWYFPSTRLENCIDLRTDPTGHADTVYFSDASYPRGTYSMEAEDSCAAVKQEFMLE